MNNKLKYRHEVKYYVPYPQYFVIKQRLKNVMTPDFHAGPNGDYQVRSLYFDDVNNKALFDKQAGIKDRVKYRIRLYNMRDDVIHFEKKIKTNDYIAKVKESIDRETAEGFSNGNYHHIDSADMKKNLIAEVFHEMKNKLLRPKVIVDYTREAYTADTGNVRITFDKNLQTGLEQVNLFGEDVQTINAIDENFIIMEVKYDEFIPDYIKTALQTRGIQRQAASKYVICRKFIKSNAWEDQ
ncbi:hypothetical protein J2S78_000745 [Salibacterium salarium]|uniref:polyphosphate polymerase domain-containing protein n=1 Tax=Salibacterium salarium TaxID=284579 RepID=UPI002780F41F|nr:polyphosphate polymerase domain-containing protein [Salibacterium salarium]MDQ0298337.1 hypothetical protein [Salibacterium salarium]